MERTDRRVRALTLQYGDDVERIVAVLAAEGGVDADALLREATRLAEMWERGEDLQWAE
jgi:hypothetical protein